MRAFTFLGMCCTYLSDIEFVITPDLSKWKSWPQDKIAKKTHKNQWSRVFWSVLNEHIVSRTRVQAYICDYQQKSTNEREKIQFSINSIHHLWFAIFDRFASVISTHSTSMYSNRIISYCDSSPLSFGLLFCFFALVSILSFYRSVYKKDVTFLTSKLKWFKIRWGGDCFCRTMGENFDKVYWTCN